MNHYELGGSIGQGGMGVVHRARHQGLHRDVAIKFLHHHLAHDPEAVERFLREARLSAQLDHPNIVRVTDTGRWEDGRPFLVMELLEGEPLSDRLSRGPLRESEAVDVACQVLEALGEAHKAGIVHRDIKPGNVWLCGHGKVKLLDFGIARAAAGTALSGTGTMIGTPAYMSPEQAEGQVATPASDLYSLGILIYEMLTGDVPFKADTPLVVLRMHTDREPPHLAANNSKSVRNTVTRALQKKPEARYRSAAEMSAALRGQVVEEAPRQRLPASKPPQQVERPRRVASSRLVAIGVVAIAGYWLTWSTTLLDGLWSQLIARAAASKAPETAEGQNPGGSRKLVSLKSREIPFQSKTQRNRSKAPGTVLVEGVPGLEISQAEVVINGGSAVEHPLSTERVLEPIDEVRARR